jgi:anti-anti-sigma factor
MRHRTEILVQALSLEPQVVDPFVVLKAIGELDLHTQDEFESALRDLLATSSVVVDLSEVEFLAVSALRTLIECHRLATSMGNLLFFAEPTKQTARLFALTGLDAVLPVAPSVSDVVAPTTDGLPGSARDAVGA